MKRQIGPAVLAAVALMCAPLAWSQSGYSTYPTSNDPQPQAGSASSSSSSQGGYSSYPDSSDAQQPDNSTQGYSTSSQGTYQAPSPVIYSTYNMSGQQQGGTQDSSAQQDSSTQSGGGGDGLQSGSSDNPQSGPGGPQDTFTHPEKLPALNLFSDAVAHTGYSFTFSGGMVGQCLGGYAGQAGYWQSLYLGTGGLNIVQVRPHMLWSLGYAAGVNQTGGHTWPVQQFLHSEPERRWPLHVADRQALAVRLKDAYFYSDDPFQPFFEYLGQPQPNNPNPRVLLPADGGGTESGNRRSDLHAGHTRHSELLRWRKFPALSARLPDGQRPA